MKIIGILMMIIFWGLIVFMIYDSSSQAIEGTSFAGDWVKSNLQNPLAMTATIIVTSITMTIWVVYSIKWIGDY